MGGASQQPAQGPLPESYKRRRSGRGALALLLAAVLVLGLAIRHVSPSAIAAGGSAAWLRRAEQHLLQWSPVPAEWTRPWLAHGEDNTTVHISQLFPVVLHAAVRRLYCHGKAPRAAPGG